MCERDERGDKRRTRLQVSQISGVMDEIFLELFTYQYY